ncbi:MAG: MBL fold metallo-hydrolase [Desulfurococcales archaeon]|nr:MBL fold metallo-hydrolase [Desulfurococcales archaeon]
MTPARIKVWLPISSLGWVNAYVLGDVIVDPGMLTGRSVLELLRGIRGYLRPCDVNSVVVTHFHVDHSTASLILSALGSPKLYIGEGDLRVIRGGVDEYIGEALELFKENGMPGEEIKEILKAHPALRLKDAYQEALDLDWSPLREGDVLEAGGERLRVIEAPGHTPGHIILQSDKGWMIVGDTLLPGITPHVTIHDWSTDPLNDYMNTLRKIIKLEPKIAYPGHRDAIKDPSMRAKEIIEHHNSRLREILDILKANGPLTGYEIAKRIRWRTRYTSWSEYPAPEKFFAMGEALAHLKRLESMNLIAKRTRNNMVQWYLT